MGCSARAGESPLKAGCHHAQAVRIVARDQLPVAPGPSSTPRWQCCASKASPAFTVATAGRPIVSV